LETKGGKTMKGQYLVGRKAIFKYPDYGTPNMYPEHTAHSGQTVEITGVVPECELEPKDEGRMFLIRAADGWEGAAWRDELTIKRS
jgi:hypothetical protein